MAQQLWVKIGEKTFGPFSTKQLKQLAQQGKVKPAHYVSADKETWVPASSVKGLAFSAGNPADQSTPTPRTKPKEPAQESGILPSSAAASSPSESLAPMPASDLSDLFDDLPEAPSSPYQSLGTSLSGSYGMQPSMGWQSAGTMGGGAMAGGAMSMPSYGSAATATGPSAVKYKWHLGILIGVLAGLGIVIASCVLSVIVESALNNTGASGLGAFVVLLGLAAAVALIIVGVIGSSITVELEPAGYGHRCSISRRVGFIPVGTNTFTVGPTDHLLKVVKTSQMTTSHIDIIFIVILVVIILMGCLPGCLFFYFWYRAREDAGTSSKITLSLVSQSAGQITLYSQSVKDYAGTRFGDPPEVDNLQSMFQNAAIQTVMLEE